jgi:hypothetical protein
MVELNNDLTAAQKRVHALLVQAIDYLDHGCEAGECKCEIDQATSALLAVVHRHRPTPLPLVPDSTKPLLPGYRSTCVSCNRNYPCGTVCDIAFDLLVDVPEELSDGVNRAH